MAPTSHDPYRGTRPKRISLDPPPAEEHAHGCLICEELAAAGIPTDGLPEHAPAQHVGGVEGDVILSVEVPPEAIAYTAEQDPVRFTEAWWAAVLPEGVAVLHVGERVIPLPRSLREGVYGVLRAAWPSPEGMTSEQAASIDAGDAAIVASLLDAWNSLGDDQEQGLAEAIADTLTPEEWEEFVTGWRVVLEAGPDAYAERVPTVLDVLGLVADERSIDGDEAEWQDMGPVPEGHVRVAFTRDDVDTDEAGNAMGYGMTGDVPTDAKAAVAYIGDGTDAEDGGAASPEFLADRARLVLAAELCLAPSKRRKSVLDAVAMHLSPAEVEERTRIVDAPEQVQEGPTDGTEAQGTDEGDDLGAAGTEPRGDTLNLDG